MTTADTIRAGEIVSDGPAKRLATDYNWWLHQLDPLERLEWSNKMHGLSTQERIREWQKLPVPATVMAEGGYLAAKMTQDWGDYHQGDILMCRNIFTDGPMAVHLPGSGICTLLMVLRQA